MATAICERSMQGILMQWLLKEKNHAYAIPGANSFFGWEADVISITKSGLAHEFEIKISAADYRRDQKKNKHVYLTDPIIASSRGFAPAYFWYATYGFHIEPPEHAGWVEVSYDAKWHRFTIDVRKEAPRLHKNKVSADDIEKLAHLLSFRIMSEYLASAYRTGSKTVEGV